jgi:hypothetical protein
MLECNTDMLRMQIKSCVYKKCAHCMPERRRGERRYLACVGSLINTHIRACVCTEDTGLICESVLAHMHACVCMHLICMHNHIMYAQ